MELAVVAMSLRHNMQKLGSEVLLDDDTVRQERNTDVCLNLINFD